MKRVRRTTGTCPICVEEYDQESWVTPLPCRAKHLFHVDCAIEWFQKSKSCPCDREEITQEKIDKFVKEFPGEYWVTKII